MIKELIAMAIHKQDPVKGQFVRSFTTFVSFQPFPERNIHFQDRKVLWQGYVLKMKVIENSV